MYCTRRTKDCALFRVQFPTAELVVNEPPLTSRLILVYSRVTTSFYSKLNFGVVGKRAHLVANELDIVLRRIYNLDVMRV